MVEMYGSTEGTIGAINTDNKFGAVGFISRLLPLLPISIIKVDENGKKNLAKYVSFLIRKGLFKVMLSGIRTPDFALSVNPVNQGKLSGKFGMMIGVDRIILW